MKKETKDKQKEQKLLDDGSKLQALVSSDGWDIARKMLLKKLAAMDSISSLDSSLSREDALREYDVRRGIIETILMWLSDVEGSAHQHSDYMNAITKERNDEYIQIYEENV